MNDYSRLPQGCHREVAPSGKLSHHDRQLSPVSNPDPSQSRIVAKFARQYGLSVPLAFTVAELAGFHLEMSDER
jgi:hypothetical protein